MSVVSIFLSLQSSSRIFSSNSCFSVLIIFAVSDVCYKFSLILCSELSNRRDYLRLILRIFSAFIYVNIFINMLDILTWILISINFMIFYYLIIFCIILRASSHILIKCSEVTFILSLICSRIFICLWWLSENLVNFWLSYFLKIWLRFTINYVIMFSIFESKSWLFFRLLTALSLSEFLITFLYNI